MAEHSTTAAQFVAYVRIDWADQVHAVCELSPVISLTGQLRCLSLRGRGPR